MSQPSFADLGVSRPIARVLTERGIHKPFPIQELVIADVLAGRDVLAKSPTGSGKTLAFGVPLIDRIDAGARRPAALVLAPTRELASQIVDELRPLARARDLSVAAVYGGVGFDKQTRDAQRAHILVATPGRLEDLLQRRAFTLEHVRTLVLDEADRILAVERDDRLDALVDELGVADRSLVFVRTKRGADRLVRRLSREGVEAVAMHGDKSQRQREKALASFEAGRIDTLVATDVAARGIDVDGISHVINFDPPADRDGYVHRVGRTGRAGRTGIGVTFFGREHARDMEKIAGQLRLKAQFREALSR